MKAFLIFSITKYKEYLSPFLPCSCRFYPTCSSYTIEALENFSLLKGLWLSFRRITRCHPYHPGGYDPVEPCINEARLFKFISAPYTENK